MVTSPLTGTNVHEIAAGIYRINTPIEFPGGAGWFSFNQYLVVDDEPLLFHTGPRKLLPLVSEAIGRVMSVDKLRYIGLSHVEAEECGALNELLALAPQAVPLCGRIAAMVSVSDLADRAPRALADGEVLALGSHTIRWFDTPHMPHGWDCGLMMDATTREAVVHLARSGSPPARPKATLSEMLQIARRECCAKALGLPSLSSTNATLTGLAQHRLVDVAQHDGRAR